MNRHPSTILKRFRQGAVILGTSVTCGHSSAADWDGPTYETGEFERIEAEGTQQPVLALGSDTHGTETSLTFVAPPEWNSASAIRFDELADAEALGTINEEGLKELAALQTARRGAVSPRTFEEVRRELEVDIVLERLWETLAQLRSIVPSHGAPRETQE